MASVDVFIKSMNDDNFTITKKLSKVEIKYLDDIFHFDLITQDSTLEIKKLDTSVNTMMLFELVKFDTFYDVDQLYDMFVKIKEIISTITQYCIGCYEKIGFQSDSYITCGKVECDYIYDELKIGSPVIDAIKNDNEIVEFLIESAFDAITCARKLDIFEPFPKYFLTDQNSDRLKGLKRGEISKLAGYNVDDLKDFVKLTSIVDKFNMTDFINKADTCYDDTELEKMIGADSYALVRFIIKSNKAEIIKDDTLLKIANKNVSVYKVVQSIDKEEEFKKLSDGKTSYLFHGSNWCNWYSILRNGLKNCSKTKLMTAGAAYGPGIYLSDNLGFVQHYGRSGNKFVMGVFEIVGDKSNYKKNTQIYVVANEQYVKQRYLIIMKATEQKVITELNGLFNTTIHAEKAKARTGILTKGIKKLAREYKKIKKQDPEMFGFRIEVDPDDMYTWKVFIFGYDTDAPIGLDMKEYGISEIEIAVKFPQNYPFAPPFLRVISPRFEKLTGHVTRAGALCMQILTDKFWVPACSIESLIITIKSEILEGGGRLDAERYNQPYSEKEAITSFTNVARGHGWI